MISVIIPVYNQADKLAKALDSLERQTEKNLEIIVVNDGSRDNPESVFASFSRQSQLPGSLVFINQENKGAPAARNRGWQKAKGDFLFFCDADAVLRPEALKIMLEALELNQSASYVYSSFRWGRKFFQLGPFDSQKLKQGPFIHTMSLIRRGDFPPQGWDENLKKFQDWDLWLTMSAEGKQGAWIDKTLFTVSPGGSISSWLPSFAYKLLPWLPTVRKYNKAKKIIQEKHGLV